MFSWTNACLRTLQRNRPGRADPKADDASTRTLNAVLRWRLRWTLSRLPAEQVQALRFLPARSCKPASATPPLRGEAPGISRLKFRRRWSTLARTFGLPPPSSMQRAKAAVEALLLIPRGETIEVIALVANELPGPARVRAQERFAVARTALGAAGRTIDLKLVDLQSIDEEQFQSILTLGSLLAGSSSADLLQRDPRRRRTAAADRGDPGNGRARRLRSPRSP